MSDRDIAERLEAALNNPADEFTSDGTPKLGNLIRAALAEIERLRASRTSPEWQPIETAPKDGTMIIGICNDHSEVYRMSWKRAMGDRMAWCEDGKVLSFGEGLFNCGGGWIRLPQPAHHEQGSRD